MARDRCTGGAKGGASIESRIRGLMLGVLTLIAFPVAANTLRVCADPDNMPYSRRDGSGFENRIAALVAEALGATLEYFWFPDRRGYLRKTLDARECDVVIGVPAGSDRVSTTKPYYRGAYVLVYLHDRVRALMSLDDARLRTLIVGVALVGNDLAATPPAHALAQRGIIDNVVGFPMFGDGTASERMIAALVGGKIDVAVMWGPQAGYFARRAARKIDLVPLHSEGAEPFEFDIAMGVRRDDAARVPDMDAALARLQPRIDRILDDFAVVRVRPQ
jgi:mxaJ protein